MIRLKIRQDFEKNRDIADLGIIDMLLHKNQQEYQETMNCWKQEVSVFTFACSGVLLGKTVKTKAIVDSKDCPADLRVATSNALVQEVR
jgi:hypothetical protein